MGNLLYQTEASTMKLSKYWIPSACFRKKQTFHVLKAVSFYRNCGAALVGEYSKVTGCINSPFAHVQGCCDHEKPLNW